MSSLIKFKPHKYQVEAITWLLKKPSAGLFFPPGLGKTAIALNAFKILRDKGIVNKVLVIAPIRVCHIVWPEEIKKWVDFYDLTSTVLHGKDKERRLSEDVDVYLLNPDGMKWFSRHVTKLLSAGDWMLIVDESSNFKNSRSKRFKTLKKWLSKFKRRVIMTGTPAPNGLENLWGQIFILDGGKRLGPYITAFRNKYFFPSGYMGYEHTLQPGADQEIYKKIDDIVVHKSRDEIDMPDLLVNRIPIELPPAGMKIYREMKNEFLAIADEKLLTAVNSAVMSGKLKQISNGASYDEGKEIAYVHDAKIEALQELIESLQGCPLLVFYEFRHDLSRLMSVYPEAPYLGGGITPRDAAMTITEWNKGNVPILFLHPQSAAHGLNLQAGGCQDVCWFSITWDQELHEQATSRVWRQGVDGAVTVHYLIGRNTIDEHIMQILDGKANLQNALLLALEK